MTRQKDPALRSGFRHMPRLLRCGAIAVLTGTAAAPASAAPEKAICAIEQAISCPPFESCERNLPGAVNLPSLLKIDRAAGTVFSRRDSGEERVSEIGSEGGDDTSHVLQGIDQGNPWSMRIDLETGRFTLTSAQPESGYVAFGLCSARILED